jgi:putative membrane protein
MKFKFKQIFRHKMLVATVVAVVILPLIYAALYLWAFWDPYDKICYIPVAIVNLDQGDKTENLGNDLVKELKDNEAMKWDFVDWNTAETGLTNGRYYSMAVIPTDFTQKIKNADKKDASKTFLEYKNREASNFMAAKFSTSAFNKIQSTLNNEITKRYFDETIKESYKSADKLKDAVNGATDLKNGIHDLATGSAELNNGIADAYDGADKLTNGANSAYDGADKLNSGINNLSVGLSSLDPLVGAMNTYLSDNHDPVMLIYMAKLNGAMTQTKTGVNQLQTGSGDLKNGLSDLKNGTNDLRIGIDKLKTGGKTINENLVTAEDGSNKLETKLNDSRNELLDKVKNENSDILSKPVELTNDSIDLVDNNGTGFVPYFASLSLWVGSMAIFFLIDFEKGKTWPKLIYTWMIATVQPIVLIIVLIKLLGLQVKYLALFFIFSIFLAWCFGMIQFCLNRYLKEAGKFVAIILLMLQLTSSAGSYPLETVPDFFKKISPYLPMTYSVKAYREIVSGGNLGVIMQMSRIILLIMGGFLLINIISTINWSKIGRIKNETNK